MKLMRDDLEQALKHDEFTLLYQPKYAISDKQITGVEALIRWQHPKYGMIYPNDFIPLAEQSEMIIELGHWVLEQACSDCTMWMQHDFEIQVAVNLSAPHLEESALYEFIVDTLQKHQLKPKQLEIELTEGLVLSHNQAVIRMIDELKTLGISFAMDDFGTGYSSLKNLVQFPIDTIKIDKIFLQDIESNHVNQVVIQSIIQLAHNLKKRVIAEGVETDSQLNYLVKLHCDQVQGKLFSMPITAQDILNLLRASQ